MHSLISLNTAGSNWRRPFLCSIFSAWLPCHHYSQLLCSYTSSGSLPIFWLSPNNTNSICNCPQQRHLPATTNILQQVCIRPTIFILLIKGRRTNCPCWAHASAHGCIYTAAWVTSQFLSPVALPDFRTGWRTWGVPCPWIWKKTQGHKQWRAPTEGHTQWRAQSSRLHHSESRQHLCDQLLQLLAWQENWNP